MVKTGRTPASQPPVPEKRGRGRPSTGGRGIAVNLRFPPDPGRPGQPSAALEALDAWIAAQDEPLTRPEAIRLLIARGIAASPPVKRTRAKGKR